MNILFLTLALGTLLFPLFLPGRYKSSFLADLDLSDAYLLSLIYLIITIAVCKATGLQLLTDFSVTIAFVGLAIFLTMPVFLLAFRFIDFFFDKLGCKSPPLIDSLPQESVCHKNYGGILLAALGNLIKHIVRIWFCAFPLLVVFYCYSHLKALIPVLSVTSSWDEFFWNLDNMIITGITPLNIADNPLIAAANPALEVIYHSLSFFYTAVLAGLYLNKNFKLLKLTLVSLIFSFFSANILYFLFPCDGPAFYRPDLYHLSPGGSIEMAQQWLIHKRNMLIASPAGYQVQIFNGIAGFPSMHIAQTLVMLWTVRTGLPRLFAISCVYEILLLLTTLLFGWHYLVDDIAGLVVAIYSIRLALLYCKKNQ